MDKIIVYVDDTHHALHQLTPMKKLASTRADAQPATTWIVVACPPRLTQHISKWVNHTARQKWRAKWCDTLFESIAPALTQPGDTMVRVMASGKLTALTQQLQATHGSARVLDARCPRLGQDLEPVTLGQPVSHNSRWSATGAVAGVGALMALASE